MKSQIERGNRCFSLLLSLCLILLAVQPSGHRPILSASAAAQATDAAGSLFKTTDGGDSWRASDAGLESVFISEIVIDPVSTNIVYASGSRGVFKSTDGGNSWSIPNGAITLTFVQALVIDPVTPSNLYAGTTSNGVFKSSDGGVNWFRINNGLGSPKVMETLAINPANPSTLYLGTSEAVFKTTDGGASWNSVLKIPDTGDVVFPQDLDLDPSDPSIVYVMAGNRIFKSVDGGANWKDITGPVGSPLGINIIPTNPPALFAADSDIGNDRFKSTDGGDSWTRVSLNLDGLISGRFGLVSDPVTPSTLYAVSQKIFKSTNGGNTWVETGLAAGGIILLVIDPKNPSTLYAGTGGGSLSSDSPWITGVFFNGNKLRVTGRDFDKGSVILLDGVEQTTKFDKDSNPPALISKKAGKKVKKNPDVKLQVRASNGRLSQEVIVSQSLD